MLEQEDLKKIGQEVANVIEQNINPQFDSVNKRLDRLESDVSEIKETMVTKDFLEIKLADLKGDIVVLVRKEDAKLAALIQELLGKEVISQEVAKRILSMEPFPKLAL